MLIAVWYTHWFCFTLQCYYCVTTILLHFLFFLSFADARFFDLSSTYYSGKRGQPARFWHFWYNTTTLYSNKPGQLPYNGNLFKKTNKPKPKPPPTRRPRPPPTPPPLPPPRPTPSLEVTPTVGVYFRTDSQFSVEQSVATQVYDKTSYGN